MQVIEPGVEVKDCGNGCASVGSTATALLIIELATYGDL